MTRLSELADFNFIAAHLTFLGIFLTLTLSLNLINGYAGMFNLAHQGFWAWGAYAAGAIVVSFDGRLPGIVLFVLAIIGGVIAATVAGLLVGALCLRWRGDFLAIGTLAFAEITRVFLNNLDVLGGSRGLRITQQLVSKTPQTAAVHYAVYLTLSLTMAILTAAVVRNLLRSAHGRALASIRTDERLASLFETATIRYRLAVFGIGAAAAGAAGALYASFFGVLSPKDFGMGACVLLLLMVACGGRGTMLGVACGTVFVYAAQQLLKLRLLGLPSFLAAKLGSETVLSQAQHFELALADHWQLIFAATLLALMIFQAGARRLPPLPPVANSMRDQSTVCAAELFDVGSVSSEEPVLRCSNLKLRYGGLVAVDDFSVTLGRGEILGLVGPNGAGKSTVFNIVTGFERPDSGIVEIDGRRIESLTPQAAGRNGIARTFQTPRLMADADALDNVRAACHKWADYGFASSLFRTRRFRKCESDIDARATAILEFVGLSDGMYCLASSMSYGRQRRLEIARALAAGPRVLLLDEPVAGMNAAEKDELANLIRKLSEHHSISIVLIEHDITFVMNLCPRVVVLDRGRIIVEGDPATVRRDPMMINSYLGQAIHA
jgi:ABC-type branched-subunit amino acid transport system ATPase component/ABC-type branched-subunit amino acid transport system permease subunit